MPNAKRIVVANHKGGVGKTTITYCLAAAKAKAGNMVLMLDMDFQCSLTISCNMFDENGAYEQTNTCELFNPKASLPKCCLNVAASRLDNLFLVPALGRLAMMPDKITANPKLFDVFKSNIDELSKFFDYIFIDLGPTLNALLTSSLLVADDVIVPVKPELISVAGLDIFVKTIKDVQTAPAGTLGNSKLNFDGIVINMFRSVVREHNEYKEKLSNEFNVIGIIPQSAIVTKEIASGRPVTLAHPTSTAAKAFLDIANKIN